MSTRFEAASSERASYASFPANTALTFCGRFYLHALPSAGNYAPLLSLYGSFVGFWVGVNSAGRLVIFNYNFSVFYTSTTTTLATDTWYSLWGRMASSNDTLTLYLNESTTAELASSAAINIMQATMALQFASNQAGYDTDWHADVSLCGWKAWSADRAASNAATELAQHALVSTTSALGAWEFNGTTITDSHTTARHLTATGTLSAGPNSTLDGGGTVFNVVLSGALALAGTAAKAMLRVLAGTPAPTGTLARATLKATAGGVAPSAALSSIRAYLRALVAGLTPAAIVTRRAASARAGAVGPAGAIARGAAKLLPAVLAPTGTVPRTTTKQVTGGSAPAGATSAAKALASVTVAGALGLAGAVVRRAARALAGDAALSGQVLRSARVARAGAIAPQGALSRRAAHLLNATLGPIGAVLVQPVGVLLRGPLRAMVRAFAAFRARVTAFARYRGRVAAFPRYRAHLTINGVAMAYPGQRHPVKPSTRVIIRLEDLESWAAGTGWANVQTSFVARVWTYQADGVTPLVVPAVTQPWEMAVEATPNHAFVELPSTVPWVHGTEYVVEVKVYASGSDTDPLWSGIRHVVGDRYADEFSNP
ncbi:MAG TPA: hypothetical protein VEA99_08240 [Gemmatimonadaceae bacterium]|nr:hypothetical protein [Gemmatimonadaceae bacterium]